MTDPTPYAEAESRLIELAIGWDCAAETEEVIERHFQPELDKFNADDRDPLVLRHVRVALQSRDEAKRWRKDAEALRTLLAANQAQAEELKALREAAKPEKAVCKGDWSLGTACRKCSRCIDSAPAEMSRLNSLVKSANDDANMYASAWQRELGPFGFVNKRHHIDAMVLTTRQLVAEAVEAKRIVAAEKERVKQQATADTLGWTAPLPAALLHQGDAP